MALVRSGKSFRLKPPGNLSASERWLSALVGLGLTLAAAQRSGLLGRLAVGTAGLSLLTRGTTGFCAMKAAVNDRVPLSQGVKEQWQRLRAGFGYGAASINSMESMYVAELQELHSAEGQLTTLIESLVDTIEHPYLASTLRGYVTELGSRRRDLERMLESRGADPRLHPDQAMRALANETRKMAQVCGPHVRDAALVGSLQRLIHYKIAAYGTVAAYAKALERIDDAARFANYADRDKAMDAQLSDIAKQTLNPDARMESQGHMPTMGESRPH